MALTHTYVTAIKSASGGTVVSESETFSADADHNISDIAEAGDVLEIDVPVDVSQIISFFIVSTEDVTLLTNSQQSPAQQFDLTAKKAIWWNTDRVEDNPLTVDITKLFFDNQGEDDATVKAGFLVEEGSS